ncbi:hypothetical protein BLS_004134 [Venturia inaequalis]|uniref:Uncharacterized protein n=1 Tax=Venturia inaequalis TaxID=5025 RepID=A0A8H3Z0F9_VENIN|nr:hypothetical protein EG328_000226 [Venturia inaequalis]KAE9983552.1 hypothetical protein BLS_004134 [Venturia inaequalis]KAE9994618.1 hypothetical protein EG327_006761 [Venturia inaequalis]RDI88139.1 hypothetical protein Vi05172_g1857 [Venturia inaequalis]
MAQCLATLVNTLDVKRRHVVDESTSTDGQLAKAYTQHVAGDMALVLGALRSKFHGQLAGIDSDEDYSPCHYCNRDIRMHGEHKVGRKQNPIRIQDRNLTRTNMLAAHQAQAQKPADHHGPSVVAVPASGKSDDFLKDSVEL